MEVEEGAEVLADHDDIDEDIKLLKIVLQDGENNDECESDGELQVLEQNEEEPLSLASASRPSTSTDYTVSSFPTTSMGTDADDFAYRIDHSSINPETCLAMNRAYQEVLLDTLRQIEMSLEENRMKQTEKTQISQLIQRQLMDNLDESTKKPTKDPTVTSKTAKFVLKTPFFSEGDQIPPSNTDVQMKESMHEDKQQVKPKTGWPKKYRQLLLHAVKIDALEQAIRPLLNWLEVESSKLKDCKDNEEIRATKIKIESLRKDIQQKKQTPAEELLKNVNSDKIDFMKISVIQFDGKYSSQECERMWRNVLHPSINRETWTKEEDEKLVELVQSHNLKNWKIIAEELGTNRTPFQCLQHFQLNSVVYDTSEWTQEEDELLREVVETCKYGTGKVQWSQVAYYVDMRSANQCLHRWRKINPQAKRGRWSNVEDCLLISSVEKYGVSDWARISETVPGRTSIQCRDRYLNCIYTANNPWTYDEDKKLLKLFDQHKNYATVALYMENRTEIALEARYGQLKQWQLEWNRFCKLTRKDQEASTALQFKLTDGGEIVSSKLLSFWAQQEKARGVPAKNVETEERKLKQYFAQTNYCRHYEEAQWEAFAQRKQISEFDYFRQEQDRLTGGVIVPRPPPVRQQGSKMIKMDAQKEKIIMLLEQQIEKSVNKMITSQTRGQPDSVIAEISKAVEPMMNKTSRKEFVEKKAQELIEKHGVSGKISNFSIRNMLQFVKGEVNESLATVKRRPKRQCQAGRRAKRKKREEWEKDDTDEEVVESEESEKEEDKEEEDEEEEIAEPMEETEEKVVTEEESIRREKALEKRNQHKLALDMVRDVIQSKLPLAQQTPGRRKVFHMFPQHVIEKTRSMTEDEENKQKFKCLALLMKSCDLTAKDVYKNASEAKRQNAARAMLLSSMNKRLSRMSNLRKKPDTTNHELMEDAELVLQVEQETGMFNEAEEDDTNEEDGSAKNKNIPENENDSDVEIKKEFGSSDDSLTEGNEETEMNEQPSRLFEEYNKCLPYIPPNLTNLRAMKTLLLEYSCLVDRSGQFFDRKELREKLYKIKSKGPNVLLSVIGSMKGFKKMRRPKEDSGRTTPNESAENVVKHIRKTRSYQQLKARFQAAFSWPALLSTITPPSSSCDAPDYILNIRKNINNAKAVVPKCRTEECVITPKRIIRYSNTYMPGPSKASTSSKGVGTSPPRQQELDDATLDESIKQVVLMSGNDYGNTEEEEEAINRLLDRIMNVYKQRRQERRRPRLSAKSKKKMSSAMESAVDHRERMKILKRLNLYDKYMRIQQNKPEEKKVQKKVTLVEPGARRKPGRPAGAKNNCFMPPNESTRRSSRQKTLSAKAQQLEVYGECGFSPQNTPKTGKKKFDDLFVYTKEGYKSVQQQSKRMSKTSGPAETVVNIKTDEGDGQQDSTTDQMMTEDSLVPDAGKTLSARRVSTGVQGEMNNTHVKTVTPSKNRKRKLKTVIEDNNQTSEPKKSKITESQSSTQVELTESEAISVGKKVQRKAVKTSSPPKSVETQGKVVNTTGAVTAVRVVQQVETHNSTTPLTQMAPLNSKEQAIFTDSVSSSNTVDKTTDASLSKSTDSQDSSADSVAMNRTVDNKIDGSTYSGVIQGKHVVKSTSWSNVEQSGTQSNMVQSGTQSNMVQSTTQSNMVQSATQSNTVNTAAQSNMVQTTQSNMVQSATQSNMVQSATQSNMVQNTTQSNMDQSETQSNMVQSTTQSNMVQSATQSNMVQNTTQSNMDQSATQSNMVQNTTQSNMEQSATQSNMEQNTTQSNMVQSATQSNMVQTTQSNMEQNTTQSNMEQSETQSNMEQNTTQSNMEQSAPQSNMVQSATQSNMEQNTTESNIVQISTDSNTIQTVTQSNTAQSETQSTVEIPVLDNTPSPDQTGAV